MADSTDSTEQRFFSDEAPNAALVGAGAGTATLTKGRV
jgi:hypothetical protein